MNAQRWKMLGGIIGGFVGVGIAEVVMLLVFNADVRSLWTWAVLVGAGLVTNWTVRAWIGEWLEAR